MSTLELADANLVASRAASHDAILPGRYVVISMTDTGSGMGAETLGQILEPFFTTKERGKGTGLGLSTVYGIVRQTGGYVAVETAPGAGTTFRVYLPRCDEPMALAIRSSVLSLRGTEGLAHWPLLQKTCWLGEDGNGAERGVDPPSPVRSEPPVKT